MTLFFSKPNHMFRFTLAAAIFLIALTPLRAYPSGTVEKPYYVNILAGQMTNNNWENFFGVGHALEFEDSYFIAIALAKRIGVYKKLASFEIEGQVVKHFHLQNHLELNALVTARWDAFWWDKYVDTSLAFGLGPSFATAKPELEERNDGATSSFLAYWMIELVLGLPQYPKVAFITRLHHRSTAFGLLSDKGGSNALAIGLKYRF